MSVRIIGRGGLTVVDVAGEKGSWSEIVDFVAGHISKAQGFFRDERLALSVGDRKITAADLQQIHNALRGQNISVVALHTSNPSSYLLARDLSLEAVWEGPSPPPLRNEAGLRGAETPQPFSLPPSGLARSGTAPFGSGAIGSGAIDSGAIDSGAFGSGRTDSGPPPATTPATDRQPAPASDQPSQTLGRWSQIAARYQQSKATEPGPKYAATLKQDGPSHKENRRDSGPSAVEDAPHDDDAANLTPWGETAAEETEPPPFVHRGTLRSGQSCRHAGTVVILGDVNPGAQVVCGGDVLVWGRLRGFVHAGAMGDEHAIVAALDFEPVQLRIAGHIAMTPKGASNNPGYWFWKRDSSGKPEVARVVDEQIYVDPWDAGEGA